MERLTKKTVGVFNYALKDHKSTVAEFGTYDAFFDYSMAVKKLGEYEDAEEQGLLIRLPCKVGSIVYKLVDKCRPRNMECPFEGGYGIDRCHKEKDRYKFCGAYIEEVKFEIAMIEELYKSIFIDRKEAEAALAKDTNVSSKGENNED